MRRKGYEYTVVKQWCDHWGKYQITAALGGNPVGITYAGTAVQTAQKVIIREFMPQDCCERAADGNIINAADVLNRRSRNISQVQRFFLPIRDRQ